MPYQLNNQNASFQEIIDDEEFKKLSATDKTLYKSMMEEINKMSTEDEDIGDDGSNDQYIDDYDGGEGRRKSNRGNNANNDKEKETAQQRRKRATIKRTGIDPEAYDPDLEELFALIPAPKPASNSEDGSYFIS